MKKDSGKNNLLQCNCDIPLARRTNSEEIEFVKKHGKEVRKILCKFKGKLEVICDKCGGKRVLSFDKKTLLMAYHVVAPKNII